MIAYAALRPRSASVIPTESACDSAPSFDPGTQRLVEALNLLETAVLLVDESACVHFANAAAREFIAGGRLRVCGGVLGAQSEADTIALHTLIARRTRRDGDAGSDQRLASCRVGTPPLTFLLS